MNLKKLKKRKGFTLIELVIVIAIIGILALMIVPQFNNVTNDAQVKTYESNCQTVVSAIAMYQAGNSGDYPTNTTDLDPYINGGWAGLAGGGGVDAKPKGAVYTWDSTNKKFTASYTDASGGSHPFTYPN